MRQLTKKQKTILIGIIGILLLFTICGGFVFYNNKKQVVQNTTNLNQQEDKTPQSESNKIENNTNNEKVAFNNDAVSVTTATPKPETSTLPPQSAVEPTLNSASAPVAQPASSVPTPQPTHEPHFVGSQTTIGYCPIIIGANMNYEAESCFKSVVPNMANVVPGWTIGVGYMIHNPSDNEDYMIDENTNRVYTEHGYMCLDC